MGRRKVVDVFGRGVENVIKKEVFLTQGQRNAVWQRIINAWTSAAARKWGNALAGTESRHLWASEYGVLSMSRKEEARRESKE